MTNQDYGFSSFGSAFVSIDGKESNNLGKSFRIMGEDYTLKAFTDPDGYRFEGGAA